MIDFKLLVAQQAIKFWVKSRLYFLWSKFHWLFQKDRLPIEKMIDISEVTTLMEEATYRDDPWYQGFDAMDNPEYSYAQIKKGTSHLDCDDYALLAAEALKQFIPAEDIMILSVGWIDENHKYSGHNVCVFKSGRYILDKPVYSWIGNWYSGKIQTNFYSVKSIIHCIIGESQLIDYFLFTPDLKLIEFHTSLD